MGARAYKLRCLVLKKTRLAETDAVLTMLGEHGAQVRAVAKGVRKPGSRFGGRLEPFSEVDLLLHAGRSLEIVREARSVRPNAGCREGLEKPAAASVVAEFAERVTRDAAVEPRAFSLFEAALRSVDEQAAQTCGLLAAACLVKAFAMMGVRPALHACALCGEAVAPGAPFDMSAGGVLCAGCAPNAAPGGDGLVSWLDVLLGSTFSELSGVEGAPTRALLDFCDSWSAEHLSVNLRSFGFIKGLC